MPDIKNISKKIPWGFIAIIIFWIITCVVFIYRNHNSQQSLSTLVTSEILSESTIMATTSDIIQEQLNSPLFIKKDYNESFSLSNIHPNLHVINLTQHAIFLPYGELSALYNPATKRYSLFLNQLPFAQIDNPIVIYAFILKNQKIIIVFDSEIIGKDQIYTMLELSNSSQKVIKEVGNYKALLDASLNNTQTCVIFKFIDSRRYSDSNDYQVFRYCGSNIIKVMDVKPESYYHDKFSTLTAKEILELASSGNCYNPQINKFQLTKACDYGIKYCYMLKFIKESSNLYYLHLQQACKSRMDGLFINQKTKS